MLPDGPPIIRRYAPKFRRRGEQITICVTEASSRGLRETFLYHNSQPLPPLPYAYVTMTITATDVGDTVFFIDSLRFPTPHLVRPADFFVRIDKEGVDWISGAGDDVLAQLILSRSACAVG